MLRNFLYIGIFIYFFASINVLANSLNDKIIYKNDKKNYLSKNEINIIKFNKKIVKVLQNENSKCEIIYLNNNQAMSLNCSENNSNNFQLIIALENGNIFSLNFILKTMPGVTIEIPNSEQSDELGNSQTNYEKIIVNNTENSEITIIKQFINNKRLDNDWVYLDKGLEANMPYVSKNDSYQNWSKGTQALRTWLECAKNSYVENNLLPEIVKDKTITSITFSQNNISNNQCIRIVILSKTSKP